MSSASSAPIPPAARGSNRVRIFFNGFAVGVLVTGALAWYLIHQAKIHPAAQERFQQSANAATDAAADAILHAGDALKAKMETLDLTPELVQEELLRTGQIVRRRAREIAGQVADLSSDAFITSAIKTKFAADPELSVWRISVSTDAGRVTLEGAVSAPEQIAKAVALAMETENVRDVTAKLKVEPKKP